MNFIKLQDWNEAMVSKENCPGCKKRQPVEELLESGCPWCGWMSDKARLKAEA